MATFPDNDVAVSSTVLIQHLGHEQDAKQADSDDKLTVNFRLSKLSSSPDIVASRKQQCKRFSPITDAIKELHRLIPLLNENELIYNGPTTKEKSFKITFCNDETQVKIDWDNELFTMAIKQKFIEFWNDCLYKCEETLQQKDEKSEDNSSTSMKYEGNLPVRLEKDGYGRSVLRMGNARITFHRTLRIPEDGRSYPLPPSIGTFEVVKVQEFKDSPQLPKKWLSRRGLILPMWQKEVMLLVLLFVF